MNKRGIIILNVVGLQKTHQKLEKSIQNQTTVE